MSIGDSSQSESTGDASAGETLAPETSRDGEPHEVPSAKVEILLVETSSQGGPITTDDLAPLQSDAQSLTSKPSGAAEPTSEAVSLPPLPYAPIAPQEHEAIPTRGGPGGKQPRTDIETLEQFIAHAYFRKGKQLALKPKLEKQIARNPRLDEAALGRLLQIAQGDLLLAVPRQLLLLSRDIVGLPSLKGAMMSFVTNVMLQHPAFRDAGVQGALRNLPEGLRAADALAKIAAFVPSHEASEGAPKSAELHETRHNAGQLFVTWLAIHRGLNEEALSTLQHQAIWLPAARGLLNDGARLRALTEIRDAAGVGLACQRFQQQASEAQLLLDKSQSEAADLRALLVASESARREAETQRDALKGEVQALQVSKVEEAAAMKSQHAAERVHLQHALQQLRGSVVKRLTDSAEMLDVGLAALRKDPPRVPVMLERAEHVLDALRVVIREMKEE
jgi:hypothetical protein